MPIHWCLVDNKFKGLADHLLGRTIVVDHIDNGIAIARKYRQSLRLLTLEGDLINPGGSMTGGAFKNSGNLLSRRREIEEFEETVALLKRDMDAMEKSVGGLKEKRAACYNENDELQQQRSRASISENTVKLNIDQLQSRLRELAEQHRIYKNEQEELTGRLKEILDNEDSIQMELETSERLEKELNEKIGSLSKILEQERGEEAVQLKASEEVHLAYASLEQQNTFILENITRIAEN